MNRTNRSTVQCTMYNVKCTVYTVHCTGYDQKGRVEDLRLHFKCEINLYRLILATLYNVQCIFYSVIVYSIGHCLYCIVYIVQFTLPPNRHVSALVSFTRVRFRGHVERSAGVERVHPPLFVCCLVSVGSRGGVSRG